MSTLETPTPGGLREQLAPHAAVGALVVAAAAARVAVHVTGDEQVVAAWVAGTAFVVGVVAATRVRRSPFSKKGRRRAFAFIAVAAGWLTAVTVTGLSLGAVGVLMALGYGLSLHWWRQHPVGLIAPKVSRSEYQRLWSENVGCSDGVLPGSRLTNPQPIAAGIRYTLRLRPGKQSLNMVNGVLDKLDGGLKLLPGQEMIVERHPTEHKANVLFTIVTKSPVKDTVYWPGPQAFDAATGDVMLGPFTDGEGVAAWRVYTETRLKGGYLQGGTEGGKSRTMEMLAVTIAASESHPTVIAYADGQGGASSPLLMEHADVRARTPEQALAMLEGMYLVMQLRQDENAVYGMRGFQPTADRPGLLGFIDECHKLLGAVDNPRYAARTEFLVAAIASEGGKVGVALILASQQSTLDAFGGGKYGEKIRSNLLTGNGAMFKGKDANAKTVFQIGVDPRGFPDMPGYAYLVNPRPGARSAPFRSYYMTDEMAVEWPKRIAWRSLDAGAAAAWGQSYLRRAEMAEEALEAARQRIAARQAGVVVEQPVPAQRQPAAGGDGAALEAFGAVAFPPSWETFVAQAQQEARKELGPSHAKVLDAIAAGHTSPQRIADEIGLSVRQVHNLLGTLMEAGRVRGGGRRYEVAEAA
ncbi:hypothetical protein AB0N38_26125 [Micromonospora aurantiaca]|uniref:helix-turn-helix transcriptional regulator n=1 Tax=Micromonospora aurantiaca (nom. illeg.) TaxID=47850 RepID=UPI003423639F